MTLLFSDYFKMTLIYIILYICLIAFVAKDKYISSNNKKNYLITVVLCIIHLLVNCVGSLADDANRVTIREITSITGYAVRPFILLFLIKLSIPNKKHTIWTVLAIINGILYITSPLSHLCVYFTKDNRFQRGPLGSLIFILCACQLIYMVFALIINYYKSQYRYWLLPPICSILIVGAVYSDYKTEHIPYPSMLNQMLPIVMFLFYLFYHLQLVEAYEKELLKKQQLQLMFSQIKPHFFFNTITTIQALCHSDPQKASETLGTFANYVRQNLTRQTENLIPFEHELEHIKTYVDIEMLRFANIEVKYDLSITDFDIAAFSIQPLIENAIKHGIRSKEHGVVILRTHKKDNKIIIAIEDNGVGFDINSLENLDDTHIGVRNVRSRLDILQNANMEITSSSEGTKVTITIPWEI